MMLDCCRDAATNPKSSQGTDTSDPPRYVPVAALKALEQAYTEVEQDRAVMRSALVSLQMRHASSRLAFVDHWAGLRAGALMSAAMTAWRAAVTVGRAAASQRQLTEVEGKLADLREVCVQRRKTAIPAMVGRLRGLEEEQLAVATLRGWKLQTGRQVTVK